MFEILVGTLGILASLILLYLIMSIFGRKEEVKEEEPEWAIRHKKKARVYAETHKAGTRVVAESKNGTWKEGQIIGQHDWRLFTFYFVVKFDDGEIIKQEENKVSKI